MSSKPPPVPLELSSSAPSYEAIMRTARNQLQQRDLGSYEEVPLYFAWERLYAAANANCSTDWLAESHEAFQRRTQGRPMARQGLPPPPPASSLRSRSASADQLKRQSALASSFLRSSTLSPSEMSSLTRTYRENTSKMKALRASRSAPGLTRETHTNRSSTLRSHRTNALIHELEIEAELDSYIRRTKSKKKRVKAKRIYDSSSSADEDQLEPTLAAKATSRDAKSTPPVVATSNMKGTSHGLPSTGQVNKTAMSWDIDLSNPASSKATPGAVAPIAVWTMHGRPSVQTVAPVKSETSDQLRTAESTTQLQYPNDSVKQIGNEKSIRNGRVNLKPKALDITQDSSFLSDESDEPISPIPIVGTSARGSLRMSNSSFGSESIDSPSDFSSDESMHSPRQSEQEDDRQSTLRRRSSRSLSQSTPTRSQQQYVHSDSTELRRSTRSAPQVSDHGIKDNEEYDEERNGPLAHRRDSQIESSQDRAPSNSSAMAANEDNASIRSSKRISQQPTLNGNHDTCNFSEEEEFKEGELRPSTRSVEQPSSERMQISTKCAETTQEGSDAFYADAEDYASPVRHRSTNMPKSAQVSGSNADLVDEIAPYHRPSTSSQSIRAHQESFLNKEEEKSVNHRRPTELAASRQSSSIDNALRSSTRSVNVQSASTQRNVRVENDEDAIHRLQSQRIRTRPETDIEESTRRSSRSFEKAVAPQQPIVKDEEVSENTRVKSTGSLEVERDQISGVNGASQSIRHQREKSAYESDEKHYKQSGISPPMNQRTPMPASASASGHNDRDTSSDRASRKEESRNHVAKEQQDFNYTNKDIQDRAHRSSRSSERQTRRETYHDDEDELDRTQSARLTASQHQQSIRSHDRHASNSNERSSNHQERQTTSHSAIPPQNNLEFDDSPGATRTTNRVANDYTRQESTQQHQHKQHRASQRSSSSHQVVESERHSSPMNKIFGHNQTSEQWTSDESERKVQSSRCSQATNEFTPASASASSDRHSRSTEGQPAVVWPPGMEGGMKGMPNFGHHPCAPPGMEHLVTDEQLSEYWTWLHWYSSWQVWYLKNERKSSKRSGSSRKHSSHRRQEYAD